jgi:ferredoxin-NADP reductase
MSSTPAIDSELKVTVKRVPGGAVSNWMVDTLVEGEPVEVAPPAGVFQLTSGDGDVVAFSGGSGITPVFSIMKAALASTTRRVRLLYANRGRDSIIFGNDIDALAQAHGDRLTVAHRLDDEHGFVEPDVIRPYVTAAPDADFYICGPGPFMDIVEQSLLGEGVDADRIHIERFTPAEPIEPIEIAADVEPVATATRVTIELDGHTEAVDHRAGTTILQTARQMGMAPPFSCESGNCATCMARLVEGAVSMHVNNALTPEEVDEGWILTCQSVPTTPTVHVVYGYD